MKLIVRSLVAPILTSGLLSLACAEEPKKTRDELVIDDRSELLTSDHWIYNDLDKGFAEAQATGKPLMVVYRCIP